MFATGTLINTGAIIIGGFLGNFFGHRLQERHQDGLMLASGISVLFIGIAGAMEGMLTIDKGAISSGKSMLLVACLALGALIGEIVDVESRFENFGQWLKVKTGNSKDPTFVNAFVTASLTVCIGAMAIVGSIQDGILGDYSILATKSVLDLIIILVMTCTLGKGCAFSAIPVFFFEGSITLLAKLLQPLMTEIALANISLIGSILIFCVGVNLVWGKKIRVANLLPAIILAVLLAYI
ncbi:hypothetical protein SAMN02910293_00205 [Streptococcus henryi]|uniref:DUF554 domain-containing protein n=1 Tax=Streptococcus henryi TaxID=439219 RepID=A0A1G6A8A5_9STRE|nr:DUF554 domain-containing protein [Streptococcus henryi]SDB04283.1 hypothetical protein SAMN02910293_00205 [Streptococcus henryi]